MNIRRCISWHASKGIQLYPWCNSFCLVLYIHIYIYIQIHLYTRICEQRTQRVRAHHQLMGACALAMLCVFYVHLRTIVDTSSSPSFLSTSRSGQHTTTRQSTRGSTLRVSRIKHSIILATQGPIDRAI